MAELLIRVKSKTSNDPYKDVKLTKRGDVIVVKPNDSFWSHEELINPDWRILRVVGLSINEAEALLAEEPGDSKINRMLQRRAFDLHIDKSDIPNNIKNWILDDTRTIPIREVTLSQVRGLKRTKQPVQDSAIIG